MMVARQSADGERAISVILPVYNGGPYLRLAVESVLRQDFSNFEFLILDDCSTDGSWEYLLGLTDSRVSVTRNEVNKGLFYNLNRLVSLTKTPLVKLWSQDDIMYPHCLGEFVRFHERHPGIGFSYSGRDIIDENGVVKKRGDIDLTPQLLSPDQHARIAFFTGSIAGNIANVCIAKSAINSVGPFNENMKISADFDMWVRLAREHHTGFIASKLIQLRDHDQQLSRKESLLLNHVREDLEVYRYLQSYVQPSILAEGRKLMRGHKLVYYYTLMVQALIKGRFSAARGFYSELSRFDNMLLLSFNFLKVKFFGAARPELLSEGAGEPV